MSVTCKNNSIARGFLGIAMTCGLAFAQSSGSPHGTKATNANVGSVAVGQEVTATGCLTKEAKEKNEFLITGEDGRTWGLKSTSVKLADHLNHKVTVTGKVTKKEHEGNEAGDLKVSTLQMISANCQP
jgi:hypothetical protein